MKNLLLWPLGAALLLGGAALPGCNGPAAEQAAASPETQAQAAHDSLMDRHDSLMDRDETLIALAARLNATPHPPRAMITRIGAANNAMLDWMHQYHEPDSATTPAPQRLAYFQQQRRQLAPVEQQQVALLDSARTLLDKLPPNPNAGPAVPLPNPK